MFKIYQTHYLSLKFLKSPKKQKSQLSPATHQAAPRGACVYPGMPSEGQIGPTRHFFNHNTYRYYLPLKFLKLLKKQKSQLFLGTYQAAPRGACECLGVPSMGMLGHKNFLATSRHIITPKQFNLVGITCPKVAIFTFLPKSGPYLAHFAPVPSGPGGAGPKFFFSKLAIDHRKLC